MAGWGGRSKKDKDEQERASPEGRSDQRVARETGSSDYKDLGRRLGTGTRYRVPGAAMANPSI